VGDTLTPYQRQNDGQCHMAMKFILSNADVEDDLVPLNFDVAVLKTDMVARKTDVVVLKSDVNLGKNNVACHVSIVLVGCRIKRCSFGRHAGHECVLGDITH